MTNYDKMTLVRDELSNAMDKVSAGIYTHSDLGNYIYSHMGHHILDLLYDIQKEDDKE